MDKRSKGLWLHVKFTGNLPNEVWKNIVGYEGVYEISNLGRIKSLPKIKGRYMQKHSHLLSPKIHRDGYLCVTLQLDKIKKHIQLQRLVALNFISNQKNLPQVNHKDGNKHNNFVDNLEWCTCKENINHAWDTGLNKHRPSTRRKFTSEQIIEIRKLYPLKSQHEIGKFFGVPHSIIGKIVRKERYIL